MKRDEALQQLSRDHHRALEVALKLRRATAADAVPARDRFMEFWREHGAVHFRVEEDVMLPAFPLIEESLPPAELEALAQRIEEAEHSG
jgi:hypothetical protein